MAKKAGPITFSSDRMYGRIYHTPADIRLFQTSEMTCLRQISLSAVSPWSIATGTPATRFEHSVGVAHLARLVGQKPEFADIALVKLLVGKLLLFVALRKVEIPTKTSSL